MPRQPTLGALALAIALLLGVLAGPAPTATAAPAGKDFTKPAIVILGYGLTPAGTMRPILYTRLLTGLAVAQMFPQSPIIVTGGNPRNGVTEAAAMAGTIILMYQLHKLAQSRSQAIKPAPVIPPVMPEEV